MLVVFKISSNLLETLIPSVEFYTDLSSVRCAAATGRCATRTHRHVPSDMVRVCVNDGGDSAAIHDAQRDAKASGDIHTYIHIYFQHYK